MTSKQKAVLHLVQSFCTKYDGRRIICNWEKAVEPGDREELAAAFAGLHNLFGVLVKRLADEKAIDLVALMEDVHALIDLPDQHAMTLAVQNDALEVLRGVLVRAPHEAAGAIRRHELSNVAPLRQTPGFDDVAKANR